MYHSNWRSSAQLQTKLTCSNKKKLLWHEDRKEIEIAFAGEKPIPSAHEHLAARWISGIFFFLKKNKWIKEKTTSNTKVNSKQISIRVNTFSRRRWNVKNRNKKSSWEYECPKKSHAWQHLDLPISDRISVQARRIDMMDCNSRNEQRRGGEWR